MQLCEFCTQYDTCHLDKRVRGLLFKSCSSPPFERAEGISQDRYEQVKALLLRMRSQAEAEAKDDRPVYKIDIPMEFTEKHIYGGVFNIPRDLHLDFLEVNLDEDKEVRTFLDRKEMKGFCSSEGDTSPPIPDLKAIQEDLREMVKRWEESPTDFGTEKIPLNLEGRQDIVAGLYWRGIANDLVQQLFNKPPRNKCTDIDRLNAWMSNFDFRVMRDRTGVVEPYVAPYPQYWLGILYFLFAKDVIEGQEYKRCPVCKIIFNPRIKKGPPGATCGKPKCRTYFSEHKEELIKGG